MTDEETIAAIARRASRDKQINLQDADVLFVRIQNLEVQNGELKASNEMAAQNMALDREYMARLESQLDALKNEHRPDPQIGPAIKTLEDYILMRCQRDRFQSYSDLEAERNRLLGALLRIEKLAQAVMPEGKP